jgi:hypothetical protein
MNTEALLTCKGLNKRPPARKEAPFKRNGLSKATSDEKEAPLKCRRVTLFGPIYKRGFSTVNHTKATLKDKIAQR